MAGRGRGLLRRFDDKACEPLRRPGMKAPSKDDNSEASIEELMEKLQLSNYLILKPPPSVSDLAQNIKDEASQQTELKVLAATVVNFGVKGRQHATITAQLVKELRPFTHNDSKFLSEFLNALQVYFNAEDFSDKSKFLAYLTLLCETYQCLGREGPNPLCFLKSFILGFLEKLLTGGSDQEISTFVELVLKLDLTENEWNNMMLKVRRNIISSKSSEKSRSSLLQLFELFLRNWQALPKNINEVRTRNGTCLDLIPSFPIK